MGTFFANTFTGGMNEVISPALLDEKTASFLANADIASGKVSSIKMPLSLSQSSPEEFGHYGSRTRSVVKWYERTYWSNNDATMSPYYGGKEENYLGIPFPDYSKNVILEKISDGILSGNFKYCVTFVNVNGWEGAPGSLTEYEKSISLDKQNVKVTVSWSDNRVSYAKIYRTAKEGADFFCIGEIKNSGGTLTDKTDDYTLAGLEPLSTIDNYPPPEQGKFLCESGGVFFLAVGSTLYFSSLGNPHAWPPLNFVGMDDVITGITAEFQGVLVFTVNNTYRIIGADNIETLSKTQLPGNQGCVNSNTIAKVSNAPLWLSNDGICMWNGESVTLISKRAMKTDRLQISCAVSANDCYFLFLRNGAIVFDHRNGGVFYRLNFSCEYAWYDPDLDIMYLQRNDNILQYGAGEYGEYKYVSPLIGLPEAEYTYFREVIICVDGKAEVAASVDDNIVFKATLSNPGKARLKFPFNTVGRTAQISVSGVGTLKEMAVIYG
jgi:hypothetical protein